MTNDEFDSFLQVEEEAHRLVDVLAQLKKESESYKTAQLTLKQAGTNVSELSTRCAKIAEEIGNLAITLRSISTSELLNADKEIINNLNLLYNEIEQQLKAIKVLIDSEQENLNIHFKKNKSQLITIRNLLISILMLFFVMLGLFGWFIFTIIQK